MTFTDMNALGNILTTLAPNEGFSIHGIVETESDYDSGVTYGDPSKKPAWVSVLGGRDDEQWFIIRGERKTRLEVSDWTVLPDVPMTSEKRVEWETYRQSLRNITDQPDPFNINWPTPPE